MNGELAQCLALVARGGQWLASGGQAAGPPPALESGTTFQFVRRVEFILARGLFRRVVTTASTGAWLTGLRSRGATGLRFQIREGRRLLGIPMYQGAGFAGSDQWAVLALLGRRAELWEPVWSVNAPDPAVVEDRRIWDVRYVGHEVGLPKAERHDAEAALRRLVAAVTAAEDFAARAGWDDWAAWLRKALIAAEAEVPDLGYHADVLAGVEPIEVRRVYAAAAQAWVFGGMGWWNDMGAPPGEEDRYDRVTSDLYGAVLQGLATAANLASAPPRAG